MIMGDKPKTVWEILAVQDPELNDRMQAWRSYINEGPTLERKYRELVMVGMCCVLRFRDGIVSHARHALNHGATKEELFAAIEQSFFIGGVPGFREGVLAFNELFPAE